MNRKDYAHAGKRRVKEGEVKELPWWTVPALILFLFVGSMVVFLWMAL